MVRELTDQETDDQATAFVEDAEVDDRLNEWLRLLYNLLIEVRGQEYYHTATSFTSQSGVSSYPLPASFMQLLGVRAYDGNTEVPVAPWSYQELFALRNSASSGGATLHSFRYRLQGSSISIQPAPPSTSFTFYIDYVPAMAELLNDNDTFDGVNGWEKWAVYGAAIDIANKDESMELAQSIAAQRNVLEAQIRKMAPERDAGLPHGTQDTRRDWGGSRGRSFWVDPGGFTWRR